MLDLDADTARALAAARAFAALTGQLASLERGLLWLDGYGGRDASRCVLTRDGAPHSFAFVLYVRDGAAWRPCLHGGLLYHGPHDGHGSGSAPTFAVTLDVATGWSIHS